MNEIKYSFAPISDSNTKILILGSMPGDKSLAASEYYAHPQNRFWSVIAQITNKNLPTTYSEKINLLLSHQIGVWDVAHSAVRKGSMDSAMKNEIPNKIDEFISRHNELKLIVFNGKKAEALYIKYFTQTTGINYLSLPSTSPANAALTLEKLSKIWQAGLLNIE